MGATKSPATDAPPRKVNLALGWQAALGLGITALAIYLALRQVELGQVWQALRGVTPGFVLLALGSVFVNTLLKAVRWKVLLGKAGLGVSLGRSLAVILAGQVINAFVPARLGDLGRVVVVGGMGAGKAFTLGTVVLEKALDLAWYGLLIAGLLAWLPLPAWINQSALALAGVGMVSLAIVFGLTYRGVPVASWVERLAAHFPERARLWIMPRIQAALVSLEVLQRRTDLFWLALITSAVWATAVLNNWFTLWATGLGHLPLTAACLLAVALQAGVSLPSVGGRIGIFETICMFSLAVFGVGAAPALAYGILLHIIVAGPATIAGGICLWWLGIRYRDWLTIRR